MTFTTARVTGRGRQDAEAVDRGVADLRAAAIEALTCLRVSHPHRWFLDSGAGDPTVAWDHARLLRLLKLMLLHAIVRGSKNAPISLLWRGERDEVVLEVEHDTAATDHHADRALELARRIARSHGGRLATEEEPWGVRITVRLPRPADVGLRGLIHAVPAEGRTS